MISTQQQLWVLCKLKWSTTSAPNKLPVFASGTGSRQPWRPQALCRRPSCRGHGLPSPRGAAQADADDDAVVSRVRCDGSAEAGGVVGAGRHRDTEGRDQGVRGGGAGDGAAQGRRAGAVVHATRVRRRRRARRRGAHAALPARYAQFSSPFVFLCFAVQVRCLNILSWFSILINNYEKAQLILL